MKIKSVSWVGLAVDDFAAARSFFSEVMGLPVEAEEADRGVVMLRIGEGQTLEIFGPGTLGHTRTAAPVIGFEVDDVAAARDELVAGGAEPIGEIGSWNGFEWLYFRGPNDHVFAVKKTPPAGWQDRDREVRPGARAEP